MKRLPLLLLSGLAFAAVAACPGKKPETPAPVSAGPDADSLARAQKAHDDSMKAAQDEADRRAREDAERRQKTADPLAAIGRTTDAGKTLLGAMIHFDDHKVISRVGDSG